MRAPTLVLTAALATTAPIAVPAAASPQLPLAITSAKVEINGTSNIHAFTAATSDVTLSAAEIAAGEGDVLGRVLEPGTVTAFDVTIRAASLSSPRDGIDRNMHKALKAQEHPLIRFRLLRLEPAGGQYRTSGMLTIAGVEREVSLDTQIRRADASLTVSGATDLLMTDYGITPPKAMLGMLRTNPKVQVRLDLVVAAAN